MGFVKAVRFFQNTKLTPVKNIGREIILEVLGYTRELQKFVTHKCKI
jgi:hypothetical protein